jgi:hypothetical protein
MSELRKLEFYYEGWITVQVRKNEDSNKLEKQIRSFMKRRLSHTIRNAARDGLGKRRVSSNLEWTGTDFPYNTQLRIKSR